VYSSTKANKFHFLASFVSIVRDRNLATVVTLEDSCESNDRDKSNNLSIFSIVFFKSNRTNNVITLWCVESIITSMIYCLDLYYYMQILLQRLRSIIYVLCRSVTNNSRQLCKNSPVAVLIAIRQPNDKTVNSNSQMKCSMRRVRCLHRYERFLKSISFVYVQYIWL
jgi:hypothetical protein